MTKEELYQLTTKFLNGTLSTEEKERLDQWYQQGSKEEVVINVPQESIYNSETELREKLLSNIRTTLTTNESHIAPVRRMNRSWWAAAAIILLVSSATLWGVLISNNSKPLASANKHLVNDALPGTNKAILTVGNKTIDLSSNKTGIAVGNVIRYNDGEKIVDGGQMSLLATPRGGQYQLTLSDGSKVWLNAASSIKFPSKFSGDKREVEVSGEVYMEIAKNAKQPFFVHTKKTMVQVLGTSFNINAYDDEDKEKTTLVEGSISVVSNDTKRNDMSVRVVLKPGQEAEITNNAQLTTYKAVDLNQTLAWKNGVFNFSNLSLKEVMRQLSRWYDLEVVYEKGVPNTTLAGEIGRDLNLSQVLKVLSSMEVNFKIEGKRLIVMP